MRAVYDLSKNIASFNFFEWLLVAKSMGVTTVAFDARNPKTDKWPIEQVHRRYESILLPGPALAGMNVDELPDAKAGDVFIPNPSGKLAVDLWRSGRFQRLHSPKHVDNGPQYTVTLRKTHRANGRDSDIAAWLVFAAEIGATVIQDYDVEPIHLHDRMALYESAEMNFFVSNGPGVLCSFTPYPCMIFDTHLAAGSLNADGIKGFGAQYPWMLQNQYAIWEAANLANIRKHFYAWKNLGKDYAPRNFTAA